LTPLFKSLSILLFFVLVSGGCQAGSYKIIADASVSTDDLFPDSSGGPLIYVATGRMTGYLRFHLRNFSGAKVSDAKVVLSTADWDDQNQTDPFEFDLYAIKPDAFQPGTDRWMEEDVSSKNPPASAYVIGQGLVPDKVVKLAETKVPAHTADKSKTPVVFSSDALTQYLQSLTSENVTFVIVRTNNSGTHTSFYSRRAPDSLATQDMTGEDPTIEPRLEFTTNGDESVDLTQETIVLKSGERQTISGWGSGAGGAQYHQNFGNPAMGPTQKSQLAKAAFQGANMNTVRIWFSMAKTYPKADMDEPDLIDFDQSYIQSEFIKYAQASGIKRFLLEPDIIAPYMFTDQPVAEAAGQAALRDEYVQRFASNVAKFIKGVKDKYGLTLYATSIANECINILPKQWPLIIKDLRSELDSRGLQAVKIAAVDWPTNDGYAFARLKAIQDDPDAWKALGIVTTHSYAMPATEDFYNHFVRGTGKEYWITESSSSGPTAAGYGVDEAHHMLNDLNNGISTWIHHEIFLQTNPFNTNLVGWEGDMTSDHWIELWPKYWCYRQISTTFPIGTVMRKAWSTKMGEMTAYSTYTAAGGKRPDGSIALSIINLDPNLTDKPLSIQLYVEELADQPYVNLHEMHTQDWTIMQPTSNFTRLHFGLATISIEPGRLISLMTEPGQK